MTSFAHIRKIAAILVLSTALVAVGVGTASALPRTFTLKGGGFGHGIGMGQYGAHGLARRGESYKSILKHYYSGTSVSKADTRTIRVILKLGSSSVKFRGASIATGGVALNRARTYTARRVGSRIRLQRGSRVIRSYDGRMTVAAGSAATRVYGKAIGGLSNGRYRGEIDFRRSELGGLATVNELSLDDYVQGVVPGEIPSSWHREALRAQAVAARSYALTTKAGGSLFDQWPDTRSQVYRGVNVETSATNAAVRATAGEVVKYKGRVATTYFYSTSGGETESIENVWDSKPVPYLKAVKDPQDKLSPYHRWTVRMTRRRLQSKLGGFVRGQLKDIRVTKRGTSPRIVRARVVGTRGSRNISGTELRTRLGLRSTWVTFRKR
ncbi:MAG: SpoIID/LytB domain-containing protein [Solirubrobacterales bacterium]